MTSKQKNHNLDTVNEKASEPVEGYIKKREKEDNVEHLPKREDKPSTQNNEFLESKKESEAINSKMKIKEIKYGMTVIKNIGNYENIRTHIEATAEIEDNEDFIPSIEELSRKIRGIGRKEYQQIRRVHDGRNKSNYG